MARDREQLIQDCRLLSGWELMTETLSLEAKVRTLITVATTARVITRSSLHAVSPGPEEHYTCDATDRELVLSCEWEEALAFGGANLGLSQGHQTSVW